MIKRLLYITVFTAFLAGCSSSQEREDGSEASVDDRSSTIDESSGGGARSFGAGEDSTSDISPLDDPASPLSVRIIYFDYDSSTVLPAYRDVVEAHARYIAQNPQLTVSLEGHTDERGSREYNLALGERRAQSVKQQMMVFGPSSSQLRTTSYGEERPIATGQNEQAWSQNRRVEILY
ncbi:MAG: peptidoglycan-associated lipoprotein Pal [Gammaproteobacteria bacterium]